LKAPSQATIIEKSAKQIRAVRCKFGERTISSKPGGQRCFRLILWAHLFALKFGSRSLSSPEKRSTLARVQLTSGEPHGTILFSLEERW
jgi:hypothetical protein